MRGPKSTVLNAYDNGRKLLLVTRTNTHRNRTNGKFGRMPPLVNMVFHGRHLSDFRIDPIFIVYRTGKSRPLIDEKKPHLNDPPRDRAELHERQRPETSSGPTWRPPDLRGRRFPPLTMPLVSQGTYSEAEAVLGDASSMLCLVGLRSLLPPSGSVCCLCNKFGSIGGLVPLVHQEYQDIVVLDLGATFSCEPS